MNLLEIVGCGILLLTVWCAIGFCGFGFFIGWVFEPHDKNANDFWVEMLKEPDNFIMLLCVSALGILAWFLCIYILIHEHDEGDPWHWHFPYVFNSKGKQFLEKLES